MRAFSSNITVDRNCIAALQSRPLLGRREQNLADSATPDLLVDNQSADLDTGRCLDAAKQIRCDPTCNLASREFRNTDAILIRILHLFKALSHLLFGALIAQLYCQVG